MRFVKYLLPLLFLAAPAFGADVTATTGWVCAGDDDPGGALTIDSGSNRKLVVIWYRENNTDPNPTAMTVGGQSATESFSYDVVPTGSPHHWQYWWVWNESAIGSMSGSTISLTATTAGFGRGWCYGVIDDTDQTNLTALTDTGQVTNETTSIAVTTTSSAGDYVVVPVQSDDGGARTITSCDTLTESTDGDGLSGDGMTFGLCAGDGTDSTTTITWDSASDLVASGLVFPNAASAVAFSSGPTVAAAADGFTISGTITNENATVYAVACLPSASDASTAEVIVNDCASAVTPEFGGNEAWTADAADSFTITGTNPAVEYKVCVAADGTIGDSAVTCTTAQRSADASQTIYEPTSYAATSPFVLQTENTCDTNSSSATLTGCADTSWVTPGMLVDLSGGFADTTDVLVISKTATTITLEAAANSTTSNITITEDGYWNPSVAVGDVIEMDDANSLTGTMAVAADGDVTCSTTCTGYFTVDYCIQDVSSTSGVAFTTPNCWTTDATLYFNSSAPQWGDSLAPLVLIKDEAMTSVNYGPLCTDPDGQTVTFSLWGGVALPSGLSLSSAGVLSGTPTATDSVTITIGCGDSGSLYAIQDQQITVVDPLQTTRRRRDAVWR